MQAVIWTDVIQLMVYLAGSFIAGAILLGQIPGGWSEIIDRAAASDKLELFDFSLDWSRNYTFWSALIGGIFITASTHGTDQLFVQRYLCARSQSDARRPLIGSGLIVLLQFGFFTYSRYYALGLLH
jgi:SSS family solute:Na+ symporter